MDDFDKNKHIVNERKQSNEYRKKIYAKKRLEANIIKKIKTTMIGALASFEDGFGHLWGIDLDESELDQEHIDFRELWFEVRSEILNKGNQQIRAAQDEISEYDTEWHRYQVDFIKKDNKNEQF
jgi:hypothetical protein